MVSEDNSPIVTGISPAEGPPGTMVKIRGENLGLNAQDLQGVFIGNVNCAFIAEWQNSHLIHCRTGMGLGMGDIIVVTKSGKIGTSLVKFRGYMPHVGLLTEAAVWVDESKLFEEKPTTILSTSRTYSPSSSVHTDPLGVAPEETGAVLPADQIDTWYPEMSSDPLSESFDPSRFLLERHLDTSFDALKSGYYHLQSQDTRKSVGPSSFVRGNLTTILDSLSTLNEIQQSMASHESESIGGNHSEELQGILKSCNFASISLFKDILSRKDEADAKRNVLNVLSRYRFLFSLPRSIERNIQQGEYEILISDYNRAKALFQNTEVKSFKKALSEVDQKISTFSTQLKHKLFDFPTPLEEQKKIIRYLNDLDYPGNAGWECITKQALWIKSMLLDCQVEHQSKEGLSSLLISPPMSTVDLNEGRPEFAVKAQTHDRTPSDPSNFNFMKVNYRSTSLPESLRKLQNEPSACTPQGILMIEQLCRLISENLSELWNLGQTYLTNQLGDKSDPVEKSDSDRTKFQLIVKDVIIVFCEMVQTVLQPEEFGRLSAEKERKLNFLVPWLPGTVSTVRSTLERLNKLGLYTDIISPLRVLTTNSVRDCIKKVLSTAIEDIQDLCNYEYWELNYRQKSYCTSLLPMRFEKIFGESLVFVHDFERDSKVDSKTDSRAVHENVVMLLKKMLEAFLLTLEKTVFPDVSDSDEHLNTTQVDEQLLPKDMQVLVLLSNCGHIKSVIMPRVIEQCVKYGYDEIKELNDEINIAIDKLDERMFNSYLEMKGEPLVGGIELGMQMAEYNWDGAQTSKGVRQYIQDILMKLVVVHNQVSSVSSEFFTRVFTALVEQLFDELHRIFMCINNFSTMGALQAHLEINAMKHSLEFYLSPKSRATLEETIKSVPALEEKYLKKMEDMLKTFQFTMRYQLATFNTPEGTVPIDPKETVQTTVPAKQHRKVKKKQSWGARVVGEKTEDEPAPAVKQTLLSSAKESSEVKKKRRAPPPPSSLDNFNAELDPSNPFFDDDV